jgi:uncharacterized protein
VRGVLLDTGVLLYALGGHNAHAEPSRRVLELAGAGEIELQASVELVREVLHYRARRLGDRGQAAADALAAASLCGLHAIEPRDAHRAVELFEGSPGLSARAAALVAFAQRLGLEAILSVDDGFDGLPHLRRINPSDTGAVKALTG